MAHSLSAQKRVRQNVKRNTINRARKSMIKTQVKHFDEAVKAGDVENAEKLFTIAVKKLDKVTASSTMHKNTVSRQKSKLAKKLNKLKAKA